MDSISEFSRLNDLVSSSKTMRTQQQFLILIELGRSILDQSEHYKLLYQNYWSKNYQVNILMISPSEADAHFVKLLRITHSATAVVNRV